MYYSKKKSQVFPSFFYYYGDKREEIFLRKFSVLIVYNTGMSRKKLLSNLSILSIAAATFLCV